jgi:hypothetical protein
LSDEILAYDQPGEGVSGQAVERIELHDFGPLSPDLRRTAGHHPSVYIRQHEQRRLAGQRIVGDQKACAPLGVEFARSVRDVHASDLVVLR